MTFNSQGSVLPKLNTKGIESSKNTVLIYPAKNYSHQAYLLWSQKHEDQFYFEFNFKTYWVKIDLSKFNKAYNKYLKQYIESTGIELENLTSNEKTEIELNAFHHSSLTTEIANCIFEILYFQIDSINDERFYYLHIKINKQKSAKHAFLPKQLSNSSDFKSKIMGALSGAHYSGNTAQLDTIFINKTKNVKDIETIPYIGYCKEQKAYIFNQFAVANGKLYEKNQEDYFEINKLNIKSTFDMTAMRPGKHFNLNWFDDFLIVFGVKGLVCLTFWFGTLFAEQIREKFGAWPFLEITGEAGAGKSFLIEFLWTLIGRPSYEGINPTTASLSGRSRTLSQVSNMPVVFIESDTNDPNTPVKHKQRTFHFDELKSLFNGRSPRVLGIKSNDNTTDDVPFRGSIVISQNNKVTGSAAIQSRLIYIHYDKSHHQGQYSREAADRLQQLSIDDVSGFLFEALKKEHNVLSSIEDSYHKNRTSIMELQNVTTERIGLTHGLLISCFEALSDILPVTDHIKAKTIAHIKEMAIERESDLISDNPSMDQFWDVYEYLESLSVNPTGQVNKHYQVNHSSKPDEIAINLNKFYDLASINNQQLDDIKHIKKILSTSIRYPYIGTKNIRSAINNGKPTYCYLFNKKEHKS